MIRSEKGFTLIEMAVSISLVAMISLAANTLAFHSLRTARTTNDHLTATFDAENAGYWVGRDAYMADSVSADNLTAPAILILKWTDWGYGTESVYHSATYTIENVSGGTGELRRRHQDSAGTDEVTLVARYVYFDAGDPANSTRVTYESPTIVLKVAARYGSAVETKTYNIWQRPNFQW